MRNTPVAQAQAAFLWKIVNGLRSVCDEFGIGKPELKTLQALVSFASNGTQLVVYAGNQALSERALSATSTVRRHISKMEKAGLVERHRSANNKRYRVLDPLTKEEVVFGVSLAPLVARADDILASVERHESRKALAQILRARTFALLRDLEDRCGEAVIRIRKMLRSKSPDAAERAWSLAQTLEADLEDQADQSAEPRAGLSGDNDRAQNEQGDQSYEGKMSETHKMSTSDTQNERHIREPILEDPKPGGDNGETCEIATRQFLKSSRAQSHREKPVVYARSDISRSSTDGPLQSLNGLCERFASFLDCSEVPVQTHDDFLNLCAMIGQMIGLCSSVMAQGASRIGINRALPLVLLVAERVDRLDNPSSYYLKMVSLVGAGADFDRILGGHR